MSPFESHSQDPQTETTSESKSAMTACSTPPTPSGHDNEAADGGVAGTTTMEGASATAGGSSQEQQQQQPPRPQTPANATTTGLISPLTVMEKSNNASSKSSASSSMTDKIKKHLPHKTNKHSSKRHHNMTEYTLPTTPQVDSYAISKIGQAREKIKRSFDKSKLLEYDEYVFPRFEMNELTLGEILGRGGFGTVLEIKAMEMVEDEDEEPVEDGVDDEGFSGSGEKNPSPHEEKSTVFRIDDFEHSKKKKSHSFRLRRPRALSHDHDEDMATSLRSINSHDGCEGLATDRLSRISERTTIRSTKSHDCIDGPEDAPLPFTTDDGTPTPAVAEGGKKHHKKRELRTKAVSWSNAKAAAHDVSHFFHRSHNKHLDSSEKENEGHQEENKPVVSEDMKDADDHDDVLDKAHPKETALDKYQPIENVLETYRPTENMLVDKQDQSSKLTRVAFSEHGVEGQPGRSARRVSRNFSFRSWRDSEAGEEGNDAFSREELEKYNIDLSYFSGSSRRGSMDPFCSRRGSTEPFGSRSVPCSRRGSMELEPTLKEDDEELDSDAVLPGEPTPSGLRNELTIDTEEGATRARRVVMFSTPKGSQIEIQAEEATPSDNNSYHGGHQDKSFITQNATTSDGDARYVIKIISPKIVEEDFKKFLQAAMDMATETYFLSVLNHPHIIKMRAVGQGDMFSPSYFLVLDRLYDTLSDRIEGTWKQQLNHLNNDLLVWNRAAKLKTLWEERMTVMKNLAGAIAHLHDMKIIYRDLKPENVGFDIQGQVKLFDFGLAKELHEEDECSNGTYKITPNTGSIRYMAPENGNKWPYNFMTDSYSFGIMLWEITALERPFSSYSPREIRDMVMRWGERPKMLRVDWSARVVQLMKMAWDSNFKKRPTMRAIEDALEKEIEDSLI